jgi:predicted Na+-dependent transporter
MTEVLLLLVKISVGALILAIGMGATFADLTYMWRRPGLLLRSLLAMYVLVPLAAFLLIKTMPLAAGVKATLLVLAVSAGAPLLPRKLQHFGSNAYVFSLVVTSSLLALVVVPAWIALLAWHFGVATELAVADVAHMMATAFLLPLAIGMLLRAVAPTLSACRRPCGRGGGPGPHPGGAEASRDTMATLHRSALAGDGGTRGAAATRGGDRA